MESKGGKVEEEKEMKKKKKIGGEEACLGSHVFWILGQEESKGVFGHCLSIYRQLGFF